MRSALISNRTTQLQGELTIPGSKSHTIRALLIASLAHKKQNSAESRLRSPLLSRDTISARRMFEQLGAIIIEEKVGLPGNTMPIQWRVRAIDPARFAEESSEVIQIDVGNSATTLYLGTAVAALFRRPVRFDGDHSIRRRSAKNLLQALQDFGVKVSTEGQDFCCPYTIQGPIIGGSTRLAAPTSQYLSALLLALPLSESGCEFEIEMELLNEHPYINMTLDWLHSQGIQWRNEGYDRYQLYGGQQYRPFQCSICADFSSATFFLCAAAITGSSIRLRGLDPHDSQGDKHILNLLQSMGCRYHWQEDERSGSVATNDLQDKNNLRNYLLEFSGPEQLKSVDLDLGATPDALPAMAVTCVCASGTSLIYNVAHARKKETDRIACMAKELHNLGFTVEENPDGLSVTGGITRFMNEARTRATRGYRDHRIIMALSLLNLLGPKYPLSLDDSSYVAVTFPSFFTDLNSLQMQSCPTHRTQ